MASFAPFAVGSPRNAIGPVRDNTDPILYVSAGCAAAAVPKIAAVTTIRVRATSATSPIVTPPQFILSAAHSAPRESVPANPLSANRPPGHDHRSIHYQ